MQLKAAQEPTLKTNPIIYAKTTLKPLFSFAL